MDSLIQKLMVSKQIMDRHNEMDKGIAPKPNRSNVSESYSPTEYNETPIPASYNIPEEFLSSAPQTPKAPPVMTEDRIKSSKLPDEIKQLMMEHPIVQPSFGGGGAVLSDEIVEGAARLMGRSKPQQTQTQTQTQSQGQNMFETTELKQMIRDVVRDTVRDVVKEELRNAGMISEGKKVNDTLQLRVGSHIFEGKVTKIKKVQ